MEIITEIYLSDLKDDLKDSLIEAIIDRLKSDDDEMELIKTEVMAGIEDDKEFIEDLEKTKEDRIETALEDKAKKILENTFYGECNIGGEI